MSVLDVCPSVTNAPRGGRGTGRLTARQVVPWLVLVGTAAAWALSLPLVDLGRIEGRGLLPALPAAWYLGLAVLLGLHWSTSRRGVSPLALLIGCQLLLIAFLFGTTALLYGAPRYPWSQKHIGVVAAVLAHGLNRSTDIYDNYPGFFLVAAGLRRATGLPLDLMARAAEPVVAAATSVAALFAFRAAGLSRDQRWTALLLLTTANWIGQGYFAPQGLAFVLALVVAGGLLHRAAGTGWWAGRAGAVTLTIVFLALCATHQLTPFAVLAQALLLRVGRTGLRTAWPLVLAGVLVAWTATAWPYLSTHEHVLQLSFLDGVRAPGAGLVPSLAGARVVQAAGPALVLIIAATALLAGVVAIRRDGWAHSRSLVLLAVAPAAVLAGQSYGNESLLRVYLLALPWASALVVTGLWRPRRAAHGDVGRRPIRLLPAVTFAVVAVLGVVASFGLELVNRVEPSDVRVVKWFELSTPNGAPLVVLDPAAPTRGTAAYSRHVNGDRIASDVLSDDDGFRAAAQDPQDLENFAVDACIAAAGGQAAYLLTGPGTTRFATLYGLSRPTVLAGLERVLAKDPDVRAVHTDGASTVWQCAG